MALIEIPEDFFAAPERVVTQPRVYYDEMNGDIKGVSFSEDSSLATYPYIDISEDEATKLMTGEKLVSEWIVDVNSASLVKVYGAVEFDVTDTKEIGLLVPDKVRTAPVTLSVLIPLTGNYLGFQFRAFSPYWTIETDSTDKLYFLITRRDNPQAVIGIYHLSIKELSSREMITVRLPIEANEGIDIYTKRVEPLNYEVEIVDRIRPLLKLPYAFDDIRLAKPPPAIIPPSLVIDRIQDDLVLKLHNGGGAIYDRRIERMLVSICAPGDIHRLLHYVWVDVRVLDSENVRISIPAHLRSVEFDICTQLLYSCVYDVRQIDH